MYKFAYLNGLANLWMDKIVRVDIVESVIQKIFPDVEPQKNLINGAKYWVVDLTPVDQFKIGWNESLHRFMIWADTFEVAKEARKKVYLAFEERYPGLIEQVRTRWDVSAKEVAGL